MATNQSTTPGPPTGTGQRRRPSRSRTIFAVEMAVFPILHIPLVLHAVGVAAHYAVERWGHRKRHRE